MLLRTGRPGNASSIPVRGTSFVSSRNCPLHGPPSFQVNRYTGCKDRGLKLPTHLNQMSRFRMSGVITLHHHMPALCAQRQFTYTTDMIVLTLDSKGRTTRFYTCFGEFVLVTRLSVFSVKLTTPGDRPCYFTDGSSVTKEASNVTLLLLL
jgi:hypothetical protein